MTRGIRATKRLAFSLVEVILAIGVFALTIMAVLAMLGSTAQSTSEVLNTVSASQIADAVRTELETLDFNNLENWTNGTTPLKLVGSKDGNSVVLESAGQNPESDPPGLANRDRFFLIEIERLGVGTDSIVYRPGGNQPYDSPAQIALSMRIYWPYQVPIGPAAGDFRAVDQSRRSVAIFNVSVPRNSSP